MSFGKLALGVASLVVGVNHLRTASKHFSEARGHLAGGLSRTSSPQPFLDSGRLQTSKGKMRMRSYHINGLEDRIKHLRDLVDKGKRDPRVLAFAKDAVTKKCGNDWCIPEKNNEKEAAAIFDAVRKNVRYTSDIHGVDTYQTPGHTLALKAGDCLPEGTLLLRDDGRLVPIESIEVGETIFDGAGWTKVTNWWARGRRRTLVLDLDNGSSLSCTKEHRLFRIKDGAPEEVRAKDIQAGDKLWQPRELAFAGAKSLPRDDAFLLGAYMSEGSINRLGKDGRLHTIVISGVADNKGIREEVIEIAKRKGLRLYESKAVVYLTGDSDYLHNLLGEIPRGAPNKKFPSVNYTPETIEHILEGLNADGGVATNGKNFVFSTTSPELAVQYRLFQRILGKSCSIKRVDKHGGFGRNPIYRVTVRVSDKLKPWAKVKSVAQGPKCNVFDIETDTHRFYVPESDVIVRNCDDLSTLICSSLLSVGIPCRFKVIRTKGSRDWNHIYAQAGFPRGNPQKWVSLDASVPVSFGWEAPPHMVEASKVFPVR